MRCTVTASTALISHMCLGVCASFLCSVQRCEFGTAVYHLRFCLSASASTSSFACCLSSIQLNWCTDASRPCFELALLFSFYPLIYCRHFLFYVCGCFHCFCDWHVSSKTVCCALLTLIPFASRCPAFSHSSPSSCLIALLQHSTAQHSSAQLSSVSYYCQCHFFLLCVLLSPGVAFLNI